MSTVAIPDGESIFYLIHICALIVIFTSMIGSIFIVYQYHQQQKTRIKNGSKQNIGHRLPYYLSIFDLAWSCTHALDHFMMVTTKQEINPKVCAFFGSMLQLFLAMQLLALFFIALYAYLLVVWEKNINMGRHDWKLLVACFANALVLMVIGNGVQTYGFDKYWCFIDVHTHQLEVIFLLVIPVWSVFVGCAFLYYRVYVKTKANMTWFDQKQKQKMSKAESGQIHGRTGSAGPPTSRPTSPISAATGSSMNATGTDPNDIMLSMMPADPNQSRNGFLPVTPSTPSVSGIIANRSSLPGESYALSPVRTSIPARGSSVQALATNTSNPIQTGSCGLEIHSSSPTTTTTTDTTSNNATNPDNTRDRVVRRMMVYIGIFCYQYIVAMIAFTILVAGFEHWILRFIVVVTINIGGSLNAIAYGRGMRARREHHSSTDGVAASKTNADHEKSRYMIDDQDRHGSKKSVPTSPSMGQTRLQPIKTKTHTNFV